ncbi:E1 ubiquitin-activating protein uba2 [Puttea exsequens]|nr:E1 ubiquitin-activating protein uba2 [Puttea exsequens]
MARDRYVKQSLGSLYSRIKQSRVLLVGAGGIGCELLKNLVLTGFGQVHVVDLDTIDLSNLNRQFLFRHEHIKKSKALVAKESAAKFNPYVQLEAHHANIKDSQFNIEWFQSFNIVFNALDNLDARRHVNKMCLAADVPMIESGTTGFNGQVQVIVKGKTECYDCNAKETPKTFPVCTIRSTPSQPIHCIVWAKSYLFTEIFGTSEEEPQEFDHSEDSDNAKEIESLRQESQALKNIRESMGSDDFARKVFEKVFKDDIDRLRSMEDMWKSRTPPTALNFDDINKNASHIDASAICQNDQKTWTKIENFSVFCDSLKRLSFRLQQLQKQDASAAAISPELTFDKDDEDALDFVAASANLRSIVFGIETRSKFDIKQMAGNIIPAIATTNAMTASLCVLQAFKVMRADLSKARMVFLERSGARVINSDTLKPPRPSCSVCGVMSSRLIIDPERATLNNLVEDVLKKQLGYGDEFSINSEAGTVYDPDLGENLSKKFADIGVKAENFLTVIDDEDENPRVNLSLSISEKALPADLDPVQLPGTLEIPRKPKIEATSATNGTVNGDVNGSIGTSPTTMKRKRSVGQPEAEMQQSPKRSKLQRNVKAEAAQSDDAVIADGWDEGTIVIGD